MDRVALIRELCLAVGVSGFEDEVRKIIAERVSYHADKVHTDVMGNLNAILNPESDVTVMVEAHMDEVGFIVSHVEPEGILRFALLGGWDPRVLPGHQVSIHCRGSRYISGTIGIAPPHVQSPDEARQVIAPEDLFIDVGAASSNEITDMGVSIGAPGTLDSRFTETGSGAIITKALDDRLGCAILIELLEYFNEHRPDFALAATFSTSEEVGLRGATTAAYTLKPHLALVVEATAGDTPGLPGRRQPSMLGKGAAVTIADKRIIVPPVLIRFVSELAESSNIPFHYKTPIFGGTDAGAIHLSRSGVPTVVLSIPCRYIHSPSSLFRLSDYESVLLLARSYLENTRKVLGILQSGR